MGLENIVGVILEQPYVSAVSGDLVPFPIDLYVSSNLAFMPKIRDAIAKSV